MVERRIQQGQVKRSADVGKETLGLALADITLAVNARRLAVSPTMANASAEWSTKRQLFAPRDRASMPS